MEKILRYDEYYRAKRKALSLLAFSDKNEKELTRKLVSFGFSLEVSKGCAEEMVRCGYIDESRQLQRIILLEANVKLFGYSKIRARLVAKGYSPEDIRRVTGELVSSGEIDFNCNAKRLVEKKLSEGASVDEKKKLLYKNGYKI